MTALKQQHRPEERFLWLFLYLPVVWAALLIAQSMGGNLLDVVNRLTEALQTPLAIRWTEYSLPVIGICSLIYGMAICVYCGEQGRTREGEEHGSATWGSPLCSFGEQSRSWI